MRLYLPFFLLFSTISLAQPNTEVYLFDLISEDNDYILENKKNISNNEGYDNQPSFYNDNQILFAASRNGQTDIATYNVRDNKIIWINATGQGSEYSPTKIPEKKAVSAIRLDTTGLQRLYQYDFKSGRDMELVKDLVIGYHTWVNQDMIASAVLADGGLNLVISNLKTKTNNTLQKKIGRSLHKIPNSNRISYISKENEQWEIRSIDPVTGINTKIINTVSNTEDMCWLINGTILMPKNNNIYKFNPETDQNWSVFTSFDDPNLWNISRITTNAISNKLVLVSEVSPEAIVQKQLEAYNTRDIDAFLDTYSDNIKLYNFPEQLTTDGKDALRNGFSRFFKNTSDLHCEIKNRIIKGNKVIDEEYVTANGQHFTAVAIYEITNNQISKVTFIRQ